MTASQWQRWHEQDIAFDHGKDFGGQASTLSMTVRGGSLQVGSGFDHLGSSWLVEC